MDGITREQIEAGARALRERQTGGKVTRPWDKLPNGDKKKWIDHAVCVLAVASLASAK